METPKKKPLTLREETVKDIEVSESEEGGEDERDEPEQADEGGPLHVKPPHAPGGEPKKPAR